jgi:hypothetical protein
MVHYKHKNLMNSILYEFIKMTAFKQPFT